MSYLYCHHLSIIFSLLFLLLFYHHFFNSFLSSIQHRSLSLLRTNLSHMYSCPHLLTFYMIISLLSPAFLSLHHTLYIIFLCNTQSTDFHNVHSRGGEREIRAKVLLSLRHLRDTELFFASGNICVFSFHFHRDEGRSGHCAGEERGNEGRVESKRKHGVRKGILCFLCFISGFVLFPVSVCVFSFFL